MPKPNNLKKIRVFTQCHLQMYLQNKMACFANWFPIRKDISYNLKNLTK